MEHYEMTAVLAGNPNVGKTTIFNSLTGHRRQIGSWQGATVSPVFGEFTYGKKRCLLVDLPGMNSPEPRSAGEAAAEPYLRSGEADVIVVVSDAVCLERGLHLLKEILSLEAIREQGIPVILCVNRRDEAGRRGIRIDFELLTDVLQFPVVSWGAGGGEEAARLKEAILEWGGTRFCYDCLDFSPRQLARETTFCDRGSDRGRRREAVIDRIATGQFTGSVLSVFLLIGIFWITIAGSAYPSRLLWRCLFSLESRMALCLSALHVPELLAQAMVFGVYRGAAWVVSVLLPPLVIFFPLFTVLEDTGYLPRLAFCADRWFKRCKTCGKQCVTMALSAGCNVAGVMGCRGIDSPRERLTAIITSSLAPCTGRISTLALVITLFLIPGFQGDGAGRLAAALILTVVAAVGAIAVLGCSWLLSHTFLKGIPSVFTLELPPYRRPCVGNVLVRSLLGRALFVLGRVLSAVVPAGLLIWFLANCYMGGRSLLSCLTMILEPAGRFMGLDGVILMAFVLGFPANELVMPLILTAYLQLGGLADITDTAALRSVLINNGWTWKTALCMVSFSVFHWPCLPACVAVRRETKSLKWTLLAAALPTLLGVMLCAVINGVANL